MTQELQLQLELVIYGKSAQVCINVNNGELDVLSQIPSKKGVIEFVAPIGGKNLAKNFQEVKAVFERTIINKHGRRRTDLKQIGTITGWKAVAKNMSNIYSITKEEAKALITPFLRMGAEKVFLFTKANSLGIPNNFCEERYPEFFGEGVNKWLANGNMVSAKPTFNEVNSLLRARASPWRVRTPHLFVTRVLNE